MGFADYMVTLPLGNYTGIKDMYRWKNSNGYPCFDVEHECSEGNTTAGSFDLVNTQIKMDWGKITSTWSRLLTTPDFKDKPIIDGNMTALFARGKSLYMYYHQGMRNTCTINFFSGSSVCNPAKAMPGAPI